MSDKPSKNSNSAQSITRVQFGRKLMQFSARLEKSERRLRDIFDKAEIMLSEIDGILYDAEELTRKR